MVSDEKRVMKHIRDNGDITKEELRLLLQTSNQEAIELLYKEAREKKQMRFMAEKFLSAA